MTNTNEFLNALRSRLVASGLPMKILEWLKRWCFRLSKTRRRNRRLTRLLSTTLGQMAKELEEAHFEFLYAGVQSSVKKSLQKDWIKSLKTLEKNYLILKGISISLKEKSDVLSFFHTFGG